jgi:hypothetical protein
MRPQALQFAQRNAFRRRGVSQQCRSILGHAKRKCASEACSERLPQCRAANLVAVTVYPVKYFAARDCAPAPNTLPAALLPSSFRNKDFAAFLSFSDRTA